MDQSFVSTAAPQAALTSQNVAEEDAACSPTSEFGKLPGSESNGCAEPAVPDTSLADQSCMPAGPPFLAELGSSETHESGLQLPAAVEVEPAASTLRLTDSSSVMDSEAAADESAKQATFASGAAHAVSPELRMQGVQALHDLSTERCHAIPEPAGGEADSLPLQQAPERGVQLPAPVEVEPAASTLRLTDSSSVMDSEDESAKHAACASAAADAVSPKLHMQGVPALHDLSTESCDAIPEPAGGEADSLMDQPLVSAAAPEAVLTSRDAAEEDAACSPTSEFGKLPGGESNGCAEPAVPDTSLADQSCMPAGPPSSAELGSCETHKSGHQLAAAVEVEPATSTLCLMDSSSVMDSEAAADESVKQAASTFADAADAAIPKLHMPGVPALHDLSTESCDAMPGPAGGEADSLSLQQALINQSLVSAAAPEAEPSSRDAAEDDAACSPTSEFGKLPGSESNDCAATAVPDTSLADQSCMPAGPPCSAELGRCETHENGLPASVELEPAAWTLRLTDSSSVMDSEDESAKQAAFASDAADAVSPELRMQGVAALHELSTEFCDAIPEPAGGEADSLPLQQALMDQSLVAAATPQVVLTSRNVAEEDAACSPTSEFGKLQGGESNDCAEPAVPDTSLADRSCMPAGPPSSAELSSSETYESGLQLPAAVEVEPAASTLRLTDSSSVMDSEDESAKQAAFASAAADAVSPELHMQGVPALHELSTECCNAIPEPAGGEADSLPLQQALMDQPFVSTAAPQAALTSQNVAEEDAACSPTSEFGKLPGRESNDCAATAVPDTSLADQSCMPAGPPCSAELGSSETHESGLQLPAPVEVEPAASTLRLTDSSSVMDSEAAADESAKQATFASVAAHAVSPELRMQGVQALHDLSTERCHAIPEPAGGEADSLPLQQAPERGVQLPAPVEVEPAASTLRLTDSSSVMDSEDESAKHAACASDAADAVSPKLHMQGVQALHDLSTESCDAIPEPAGGEADSLMDQPLVSAAAPEAVLTSRDAAEDDAACSPTSEFGKLPGSESNDCAATAVPDTSLADQSCMPAGPPSSAELGSCETHKSGLLLPAAVEVEPATSTLCLMDSSSVMDSEAAADESVKQAASTFADAADAASPKLHMPGVPALHDLSTESCDAMPGPAGGEADSLPLQQALINQSLVSAAAPEAEPSSRDAAEDDAACSPTSEFGKLPGSESNDCAATAVPDTSLADQSCMPAGPPCSAELGSCETHEGGLPASVELEPAAWTLRLTDSLSVMDSEDESAKQAAFASDAADAVSPELRMQGVAALHELSTEFCDAIPEPAGGEADSLPLQQALMDQSLVSAATPQAVLTSRNVAEEDAACSPTSEFGKLQGGESNDCAATAVPDTSLADQSCMPAGPPCSAELGSSETHESGLPAPVEVEPAASTLSLTDSSSVMDSEAAANESAKQATCASAAAHAVSPELHTQGVPALHDHDEVDVDGSLDTGSAMLPQGALATEPCDLIPEPAGAEADSQLLQQALMDQALVPAATPEAEPTKPKLSHSASTSSLRGSTSTKAASMPSKGEAGHNGCFHDSQRLQTCKE